MLARELAGDELVTYNPDVPLPPASNTKLLTAALALYHLGPDYRFETRVFSNGNSLVLAGRGNPSLSPTQLSVLAERVRNADIDAVTNLVADVGCFSEPSRGPGWMWEDGKYSYGAESTALALSENTVSVTVSGTDIEITPKTNTTEFVTDFDPTADELHVFRDGDEIRIEGKAPDELRTETVPVPDPVCHCLLAFRDALEETGIAHTGGLLMSRNTDSGAAIATVKSPPVSELVREMNVPSNNFLAEQLARTVAREVRGDGSWDEWETVVNEFLDSRNAGGARIRDGSGLSRYNLLPARGIVRVLEWVEEQSWSETFFASLPKPGEGTLEERLLDVVPEIRAKTGTLTGSRTLSGIVRRDGEESDVVFSVLLGGLTGEDEENARETIDDFVRELAD
ncbi:D-alanyl-D-alanine carboxypeptidase/D-alanyl-D-alanine-endopeptidase [Halobacterium noricense]|uniref:D-alanyl-D-alanine carboxypeptidase/D-alanyl-D-alanine-endopeptidase n=1 Tax=Haladaptatus pallidirubidus TaxID=1008152 RepID=A0AAV3UEJ1_9EURY